jgi:hypothetical protein
VIPFLIQTLKKSAELDMADEIAHVIKLFCVQVRRLELKD